MDFTDWLGRQIVTEVNLPFLAALLATACAQGLKVLISLIRERRWDPRVAISPGGMPSAHAALAASLFVSMGLQQGWTAASTGVAGILAIFVLYDAVVIRRTAAEQARAINHLLAKVDPDWAARSPLRESFGHTGREVLAGCAVGVLVALFIAASVRH